MNIILLFLASIACAAGRTSMPVLQLLQTGQVDTAAIHDDAVDTPKIKTDSVTSAKLLSDSGGLAKVTGGAASVSNGNVGIGTTNPKATLDVAGPVVSKQNLGASDTFNFISSNTHSAENQGAGYAWTGGGPAAYYGGIAQLGDGRGFITATGVSLADLNTNGWSKAFMSWNATRGVAFGNGFGGSSAGIGFQLGASSVVVTIGGNVGIGTASPATKLHMSSGILTIDGNLSGLRIVEPNVQTVKLSIDPVSGSSTFGSSMTVGGSIRAAGSITLPNQNAFRCEDSGGSPRDLIVMTSANNLSIGNSAAVLGRIDFYPGQSAGLHMYTSANGGARLDSTLTSISSVTLAGTTPVLRVGTNISGSIIIDSGASDTAKLQIGSLTRPGCFTIAYANTTGCAECCMISGNTTPTCGSDADCVVDGTP